MGGSPTPAPAAEGEWAALVPLLDLTRPEAMELAGAGARRARVYAPLLERRYDNATARLRDLEQIERLASRFDDRPQLLADMALDPPAWAEDLAGPPVLDEDFLILSTMHSAKGLEWDAVYVIHAADGNIPSDMATGSAEEIEEERRLFYVACTRARDWLYVCFPLRYYTQPTGHSDAHGYSQLTRFLSEAVLPHFVSVHASPVSADDAPDTGPQAGKRIRAGIKAMWSDPAA